MPGRSQPQACYPIGSGAVWANRERSAKGIDHMEGRLAMLNRKTDEAAQPRPAGNTSRLEALCRAKSLFDAGDLGAALLATDQILDRDPDHLGALEVRVRALWRLGDFPAVLRTLGRLAMLNPYEPGYFLMQGNSLRMLSRLPEARSAYERCATIGETSVREEAVANIVEIDAQLGPSARFAPVPVAGITEFLPATLDSLDALIFVDRGNTEDRPTWTAAVRPS